MGKDTAGQIRITGICGWCQTVYVKNLNVYTHVSFDRAAEQMVKVIDFKAAGRQEKQRKSG